LLKVLLNGATGNIKFTQCLFNKPLCELCG
jgi:hypothetical protein